MAIGRVLNSYRDKGTLYTLITRYSFESSISIVVESVRRAQSLIKRLTRILVSSISLRTAGFVAPMILGGALVAIYLHVGIIGSSAIPLPSGVLLDPSTAITSTQNTKSNGSITKLTASEASADAGDLVVVTPTNGVLAYDNAAAAPTELDPNDESDVGASRGTTTTTPTTTSAIKPTTTTTYIVTDNTSPTTVPTTMATSTTNVESTTTTEADSSGSGSTSTTASTDSKSTDD